MSNRALLFSLAATMLAMACAVVDQTSPATTTSDISEILISPNSVSIAAGQSVQFEATGRTPSGQTRAIRVRWSATGGTIDANGLYTADSMPGAFEVTASLDQQHLTSKALISNHGHLKQLVLLPAAASVAPGGTVQFSSFGQMTNGDSVPVSATYSATGGSISTSGLFTAGSTGGSFVVIATVPINQQGGGTRADTSQVAITGGATPVPVNTVVVTPTTASIAVGVTVQLTATPKDANGNVLTGRTITWSSSTAGTASVDGTGLVTGVGAGAATITATCEGTNGTSAVTVTSSSPPPPPPAGGCTTPWPAAVYPRMPLSTGQAFYVSASSGNDANPGTITAPWKTLQKAFDALQPGQLAYLRGGTYGAFCTASTFSRAGTLLAPITVQGYPGERAVIHGQIRLDGSYFRLSSIVAEGPTCGTWGATTQQGDNMILMTPGLTHHVEVSNSEVYHDGWHAGVSAGGDDIWILNNYIHDNGGFNDTSQINTSHGIYYHDGTRGVVANNILEHNRAKGLSARFSANHIIVVNNTVVGNGRSGMDIAENTNNWLFANNVVENNGNVNDGEGINTSGSSGGATNIEINNVFWNNGASGTSSWDANATITNNVVANPLLVNPANSVPSTTHQAYSNDYHLQSGSPAINFGTATYALPFAIDGNCRPQGSGPDAGAYEQ